jgi:hypothetical protein
VARQIVIDIIGDSKKYTKATDDALRSTAKLLKPLDDLVKRGGIAGSIMQGVGQSVGQMLNPMSLATRAFDMMADGAGKVASSMVNLGKAYRDDRLEQDMLNNTLMRNVDNWREYTSVIDDAIQSGQKLAFTDSDIRESLGRLVTATKDVNAAIKYNRLAMDIARQRNIKLSEASKAVTKAAQGQTRALKGLGYQIDTTASATEALDSVQRQAAGAAETWSKSPSGKLAARLIEITEKAEANGKSFEYLAQTQNDLALTTLDVGVTMTTYLGIFADFLGVSKNVTDTTIAQSQAMANMGKHLQELAWSYKKVPLTAAELASFTRETTKMFQNLTDAVDNSISQSLRTLDAAKAPWRTAFQQLANWVKDPFRPAQLEDWVQKRIKAMLRKADEAAANGEGALAKRWRRAANMMKSPVMRALINIGVGVEDALAKMALVRSAGKGLRESAFSWFDIFGNDGDGGKKGGKNGGGGKKDNQSPHGPSTGKNARGTSNWRGGWSWVGEEGPELMRLPRGTAIKSNPESMRATSGSTINVTINAGIGTDPAELGRHVTKALRAYGQGGGIPSMKSAIGIG